jgi:hypothetical protein
MNEMGNDGNDVANRSGEKRPENDQETWPGFASRLAELVSESWGKAFRLTVFAGVLGVALISTVLALWWLHGVIW